MTGASGFLGTFLVNHLESEGTSIVTTSLAEDSSFAHPHIACDLRDFDRAEQLVLDVKPDRIYHLAGIARVSDQISFETYFINNFLSTVSLLEALEKSGRESKFFLTSSVHVYGKGDGTVTEESTVHPLTDYGFSKYLAEQAVKRATEKSSQIKGVVGRLYSCIGPGQPGGFVASDMCQKIVSLKKTQKNVLKTGPLSAMRRFLDARDVAPVMSALMENPSNKSFEIFNIASPNETQISEIVETLLDIAGINPKIESTKDFNSNRFRGVQISTDKLNSVFPKENFRPLSQTLKDMFQWASQHLE